MSGANDRRATLEALCDALFPALDAHGDSGPDGVLLRLTAGDLGIADRLWSTLSAAQGELLDRLAAQGFADASLERRTELVLAAGAVEPERRQPLRELKEGLLSLCYTLTDAAGSNPTWPAIGYPGPISAPPSPEDAPKTIRIEAVDHDPMTLTADVCVVGSGAGGAVIAAELQRAGRSVVVLEAGSYRNEADFTQLEIDGSRDLYLRGGVFYAEGGTIGILAGATLGGGTVVNSLVCLRPPDRIRRRWAEMGLDGVDGPEFDAHIDAVWDRLGVNTEGTHVSPAAEPLVSAMDAHGITWERVPRNASLSDDPQFCGYCNNGCQQGCKRSTLRTYLQDAADAGTRFVVDCRVDRVLVEDGRARGVEGTVARPDGGSVGLTVRADAVVVAAGGIESPGLLLRSGIGGSVVGAHLRLHPAYFVSGVYEDRIAAWEGQIQSVVSFDFVELEQDAGFLVEHVTLSPAFWGAATPWRSGSQHKREMTKLAHVAPWHGVTHDHGSGRVVLDDAGRAAVRWHLDDELDRRVAAHAHVELARLHRAAGSTRDLHLPLGRAAVARGRGLRRLPRAARGR